MSEPNPQAPVETISGQQEWEYELVEGKTAERVLSRCRRLGSQGWELVTVVPPIAEEERQTWRGFLKRPRAFDEGDEE